MAKTKYDPKGYVTNEYLDDAVNIILKGMDTMIKNFRVEVKGGFDKVGLKLNKMDVDISSIKDDVKGLTSDLSSTVSKKDFNTFKIKMNRFATS